MIKKEIFQQQIDGNPDAKQYIGYFMVEDNHYKTIFVSENELELYDFVEFKGPYPVLKLSELKLIK
jgi:hypothetical protein